MKIGSSPHSTLEGLVAVNLRGEGPLELEGHGHVANVGLASVAEKKVPYTVNVLKFLTLLK